MSEKVTDECLNIYKNYDDFQREVVAGVDKTTFTNEQIDKIKQSPFSLDRYQLIAICTNVNTQKVAYGQWKTDINILWDNIKNIPTPIQGGSQSGGTDCPADFQKIFNYMFLIAASASIAVMSPDIELVTNVCMKALKLAFGTIVLPIINLLSVIFTFMLQSLVLIVKTAAGVAIEIISNFIKTLYVNIYGITTGVIGVAKVFIYNTLTYCGSFYNKVANKIAADDNDLREKIGSDFKEPVIDISNMIKLTSTDETIINKSLKTAIIEGIVDPKVEIEINEEPDIFMNMLVKCGSAIDKIYNDIKFGYTFLRTAYLLLCENAHHIIKDKLGGAYYSNKAKLSLTKGLIYAENSVIRAVNGVASFPSNLQAVIIYNINILCLKILKIVYSDKIEKRGRQERGRQERGHKQHRDETRGNEDDRERSRERNQAPNSDELEDNMIQSIVKKLDINESELVFNLDIESLEVPKDVNIVKKNIEYIETDVGQLTDNSEYTSIMEDLDRKLQEIIDRNNPPAFMKKGGAKKRRTKKAKKHINKRRYSRKH